MLQTMYVRAVDEAGCHVQAVYAAVPSDHIEKLSEQVTDGIKESFQRAFGHEPTEVGIGVVPYVPDLDDEEE